MSKNILIGLKSIYWLCCPGNNTFDIALDKNAASYLSINTAGIPMEIEINGAGDNTIIIFQSP